MLIPNRLVGSFAIVIGVGIVFSCAATAAGASRSKPARSTKAAKTSTVRRTPQAQASHERVHQEQVRHTVLRGQTLYSIARQYGVALKTLSAANGIADPARVKAGTRLVIPGARVTTTRKSRGTAQETQAKLVVPPARSFDDGDDHRAFLTAPLAWPVDGQIVSEFARPRRGHRHKGIDIKSHEGAPVRAVADGVVVRAEERYGSYGRLIVIEHENGMQSYYGHNKKNLVRPGQSVSAEETIGLVGHSGNATCDHLHFELRVRGQAIDPRTMLATLPNGPGTQPREPLVTKTATPSGGPSAVPSSPAVRR